MKRFMHFPVIYDYDSTNFQLNSIFPLIFNHQFFLLFLWNIHKNTFVLSRIVITEINICANYSLSNEVNKFSVFCDNKKTARTPFNGAEINNIHVFIR